MSKTDLKYNIKRFVTAEMKAEILKKLDISEATYYRKVNATFEDDQGFEIFQLLKIGEITNQKLIDLVNKEHLQKYTHNTNLKF
jgi:hypothetical protein